MSNFVIMGERGRVALPTETIDGMNWKPGQRLQLCVVDGRIVLEAFPRKAKPIA